MGVCVYFIAGSGLSKLLIGGLDWLRPETMREILRTYGTLPVAKMGPASKALNSMHVSSDLMCSAVAAVTIAVECVVVPASLCLPAQTRVWVAYIFFGMHVGIAAIQ